MNPQPQDPFFEAMYQRMSPGARYSFTTQQLDEIKRAFGARGWGRHTIDLRVSLPLIIRSYYVVLLLGPERRTVPRLNLRLNRYILSGAICVIALGFLLAFYSFYFHA